MDIHEVKKRLVKRAIGLSIGNFTSSNPEKDSWIGRVCIYGENEEIPLDDEGYEMLPLLQLHLANLPFVPEELAGIKALTLFISENQPYELSNNGEGWLLREYTSTDDLVFKDLRNPRSPIRSFPLKASLISEDYPSWDGGAIPADLAEEIQRLEKAGVIEDYYDAIESNYGHKLGGYPTFHQQGVDFGEDFQFVFQIDSDDKARLNIIDGGTFFLARNKKNGQWRGYCDFT